MSPDAIFARLVAMFGNPNTPNPDQFTADYLKALTGLDPDLLAKAADAIIRTAAFWPRPGEIYAEYLRLAQERDRMAERRAAAPAAPLVDKSKRGPEWQAQHDALMASWRAHMAAIAGEARPSEYDWSRGERPSFLRMQCESRSGLQRARPSGATP